MGAVLDRIPEEQIEAAKRVDLIAVASRHTQLHKESSREYSGPCPRPGCTARDNGFHVHADGWFFCRKCHEKRGDSIEFVRWLQPGLSFREAVAQLAGGAWPTTAPAPKPQPAERQKPATKSQLPGWRKKATALAAEAHERLWAAEGTPARAYLLGRGLEPHTWLQYGVGYRPDAPLPGTKGAERAPALVLPWRSQTGVYALRYRFLEMQRYTDAEGRERAEKLVAETGSQFAGKLFGGQALPEWVLMLAPDGYKGAQRLCTLLIVEGELNAMSAWQVAGETRLHVLSIGSESQRLTPAALKFAQGYGQVLVWADKAKIAQQLMAALPGAVGIQSPGGKDANDLLQASLLGGFLATMRANHAKGQDQLEGLLWALYDAAALPLGIDTGSAKILQRLAAQLGKGAAIYEAEPGRWITGAAPAETPAAELDVLPWAGPAEWWLLGEALCTSDASLLNIVQRTPGGAYVTDSGREILAGELLPYRHRIPAALAERLVSAAEAKGLRTNIYLLGDGYCTVELPREG